MGSRLPGGSFGEALATRVIPPLVYAAMTLLHRSIRWRWEGEAFADDILRDPAPFITVFWHSRIPIMTPLLWKSGAAGRDAAALISNNRDGGMISAVAERFGAKVVRGSTRNVKKADRNKGGGAALRGGLSHLREGGVLVLTPDGPRGPRQRVQVGASAMAAQTGASVLPMAVSVKRGKVLNTWDRMMLPYPFTRGIYVCGEPIPAPAQDDDAIEAHRLRVENALQAVTRRADAAMGRVTPDQGEEGRADR